MSSIYSNEYQLVIKLLRSARIDRKFTQSQLAESLGKPQSFVAKVENGERRLDVIEFAAIARLLSLDPAEILSAVMK
ncbi:helix-turn-helix transcriptional regulator [Salmonella enterica subsp. enterica serovar Lagos]|uniref:helix-turn-helix domain-containing protein n=1 Tax=Salmonella enterica TaxID=28901 RepID=UPI001034131F|nr:helix-turn-helix transcriptional regulator [Salmonella enterica]EBG5496698.1 helix-turn-helix transcriptional regulator [Salmonella enterica subsp. enterica serovar Lagos]EAP5565369.1 XRE family transcriptional regulator [Salmonella enterica]EAU3148813.1 XRE family transcriptional regulator [Salmonella enterica]EBH8771138.1 XRE family transcriptional regulator [Salmonella enterica subsp. enterica serovar Lagos]ECF4211985.1 XRE family transcriptional regulator [Salmonella enterica subsp. ent